jgi:hypothetical protein
MVVGIWDLRNFTHLGQILSRYASTSTMTAGRNHRLPRGFNAPTPLGLLMKEMFKPGLKATEVTVSAAQAWKGMNGDEKQVRTPAHLSIFHPVVSCAVLYCVHECRSRLKSTSFQKYIDQAKVIGEQRRSEFERLSDEKQHELVSEAKQKMESRKKRARRAEIREVCTTSLFDV